MVLNSKRVLIGFFIYLALVIGFTVFYLLSATFDVIKIGETAAFALAFSSPFVYSILCIFALVAFTTRRTEKLTKKSNEYDLGKSITFFTYQTFERRTEYLERRHSKKLDAYAVAFTLSQNSVVETYGRNNVVTAFMGDFAVALTDYFVNKSSFVTLKDACFGFYHGLFLVYAFVDADTIRKITSDINDLIFNVAKEKDVRIYVQPFFGIAKVDRGKDSFKMTIDNVIATRNLAERRFERFAFYNPAESIVVNVNEANEIKEALANKEFVVYYQPKFSLKKKEFISAEALVRWDSKIYGLLPPAKFIEKAESSGLIHEIDRYVFEMVCSDLSDSKKRGRRLLPVSVNFSMYEFFDANFVNDMVETCKRYNIPNSLIEVEVTESASQANSFMAKLIINKLKENGFRVLMDDFGTGFSNIENLMNFPFDSIKLDRSYIIRIQNDQKSRDVVKLLINLAKLNNMEVIAEGVDDKEQVDILRKNGCDTIQGFYYSRPVPKNDYYRFIAKGGNQFENKVGGKA